MINLVEPLDVDTAFSILAPLYIDNIGISIGLRTIYWDSLIAIVMSARIVPSGKECDHITERLEKEFPNYTSRHNDDVCGMNEIEYISIMSKEYKDSTPDEKHCIAHALCHLILNAT